MKRTFRPCFCGTTPVKMLSQNGEHRVGCPKLEGGCGQSTKQYKDSVLAHNAWNLEILKREMGNKLI